MPSASLHTSIETVRLRPEPGCCGQLNWRLDLLGEAVDVEALVKRLAEKGYRPRCCRPFLVVVRAHEGHEIAVVPATGRAQLRVDRLSAAAARPGVARRLAADLLSAC